MALHLLRVSRCGSCGGWCQSLNLCGGAPEWAAGAQSILLMGQGDGSRWRGKYGDWYTFQTSKPDPS